MTKDPVKVGILGSQFQAECHAAAINMIENEMSVVAVASPTPGNAQAFADRHKIPNAYLDYRELLADPQIEAVTIAAPNSLHCEMAVAAAQAGKNVICEKPLCITLSEADQMIDACSSMAFSFYTLKNCSLLPNIKKPRKWPTSARSAKSTSSNRAKSTPARTQNGFGT